MRSVLVCVGKDYDLMIVEIVDIEVLAYSASERGDYRTDLLVCKHLVDTLFLGV